MRQITLVPLTLAAIAGVMNLRGQIVAMIYLRKYLGLDQKFEDAQSMGETVEYNNDLYTLLVDTIGNVQNLHHRVFNRHRRRWRKMFGNFRRVFTAWI